MKKSTKLSTFDFESTRQIWSNNGFRGYKKFKAKV